MKRLIILLSLSALAHGKFFSFWSSGKEQPVAVKPPAPPSSQHPRVVYEVHPPRATPEHSGVLYLNQLHSYGSSGVQSGYTYEPLNTFPSFNFESLGGNAHTPVTTHGGSFGTSNAENPLLSFVNFVQQPLALAVSRLAPFKYATRPTFVQSKHVSYSHPPTPSVSFTSPFHHTYPQHVAEVNHGQQVHYEHHPQSGYVPEHQVPVTTPTPAYSPPHQSYPGPSAPSSYYGPPGNGVNVQQPVSVTTPAPSFGVSHQSYPAPVQPQPVPTTPQLHYGPPTNEVSVQQSVSVTTPAPSFGVSHQSYPAPVQPQPVPTTPQLHYGPPTNEVSVQQPAPVPALVEVDNSATVTKPETEYGVPQVTSPAPGFGLPVKEPQPVYGLPDQHPNVPHQQYGVPVDGLSGGQVTVDTPSSGGVLVPSGVDAGVSGGLPTGGGQQTTDGGATGGSTGGGLDVSVGVGGGATGGATGTTGVSVDLGGGVGLGGEVGGGLGGDGGLGVDVSAGIGGIDVGLLGELGLGGGGGDVGGGVSAGVSVGGSGTGESLVNLGVDLLRDQNGQIHVRAQPSSQYGVPDPQRSAAHIVFPSVQNDNSYQLPVFDPTPFRTIVVADNHNAGYDPNQYEHSYNLQDGTRVVEKGQLKTTHDGRTAHTVFVKSGEYEYITPEGEKTRVQWVADENGFRIVN